MSFLTKTFGLLRKSDQITWPVSWNQWLGGATTHAGEQVDSETAMRLSAVYGSRRIIAYTIAGLPAHAFLKRPAENGRSRRELMEPQPQWLDRPNRDQLWPEFIAQAVDSLLGDGNLFLDVSNKGRDGKPAALFVLNPKAIVVGRREDTNEAFYSLTNGTVINRDDIIHVRALTLPGHLRGFSPIEAARQEAGIGIAAQKYVASFYVNGANVSAILEFSADFTREQVLEHTRTFKELYTGSADKAHTIAGVAGAQYKPMGITHQQAQFLELRQFTVIDIGTRIYGIPAWRLGAALETPQFGNSLEQSNMSFTQDAIMPWTTLLEAAFSRHLLMGSGYFKFNLNGLLRGDAASRAAFYMAMRQQLGVFNGDDVAELEDMNPLPEGKGQSYWMPANTYLVGPGGFPILPERQSPPASEGGSQ